jgi:hypothetical protein
MASSSLADSRHETIPEYVLRGRGLFETYSTEILAGYQGGGLWLIPSGLRAGKAYETRPGTRRKATRCECIGFQHHSHCSHVEAARLASRKSAVCDSCGERRWHSDLTEVFEEDGLLSWFAGDVLCGKCIDEGAWV